LPLPHIPLCNGHCRCCSRHRSYRFSRNRPHIDVPVWQVFQPQRPLSHVRASARRNNRRAQGVALDVVKLKP
jgi:hypothetical protein